MTITGNPLETGKIARGGRIASPVIILASMFPAISLVQYEMPHVSVGNSQTPIIAIKLLKFLYTVTLELSGW